MSLTADPLAWLRPFFTRLHANPEFRLLAPSQQFAQLCEAVAVDHPTHAAQMHEWSVGAQEILLKHLAVSIEETPPSVISELWRLRKGDRELRCIAHYLASGIDLRLLEGDAFRRTQLCRTAVEAEAVSTSWRTALVERGWK
jgi:hypothetical protein